MSSYRRYLTLSPGCCQGDAVGLSLLTKDEMQSAIRYQRPPSPRTCRISALFSCLFILRTRTFLGEKILSKFEKDSQMALMSTLRGRKVTVLVCVPHRFITQPPSPNVNQLDGFIFIRMNEKCFMKRKIFSVETGESFGDIFFR